MAARRPDINVNKQRNEGQLTLTLTVAVRGLTPGFSHRLSAHLWRMAVRLKSSTRNNYLKCGCLSSTPHPGDSALVGLLWAWILHLKVSR